MDKTSYYSLEDKRVPFSGELIKLDSRIKRKGFTNIIVAENWTVRTEPQTLDFLIFKIHDFIVIFQVLPTGNLRKGLLKYVGKQIMIDNWRASKRRPKMRLDWLDMIPR